MKQLFRLQYEFSNADAYTEKGVDLGAKLRIDDIDDAEVRDVLAAIMPLDLHDTLQWTKRHQDEYTSLALLPLTVTTPEAVHHHLDGKKPHIVFCERPLHTITALNEVLYALNDTVDEGTIVCCHSMTATLKRHLIMEAYPFGIRQLVVAAHFLWHRVCPKLGLTRRLYFAATGGKNRTFHRVEVMGRLYRAGFEVLDEQFRMGHFFVVARKVKAPINDPEPLGSPIIHLKRKGKEGRDIVVHKFRTMYTYSEYIQPYLYHYQHLQKGGKFKDDYRVTPLGRIMRRWWLDELPMLWNLLRGDLKLVGVRPLSEHYFSLYSPEMQELRSHFKPGLVPPFFYERNTPSTIDEIQASERRYLEAYMKAPLRTDWKYFWGILTNIILRKKHSA